jgi:glycosyltransferase involved in cell wall biosynthesis
MNPNAITIKTPKVSVVICAYNVSKLLNNVMDSLEKQTFKDFEIVVVNDGSTDDTSEIAKKRGALVVDIPHKGLSAARNAGINNSSGEIVAIIDADCHAEPQWLEEACKEIRNGEVVVTGNTKIPKSTFFGDCISGLGYPGGGHLGFEKMWKVDKEGHTDHLAGGNCAFRKKEVQSLGAFNQKLTITADDVFLSMKVLEAGWKIKYNPKMVMYHPPRKDLRSFVRWHYLRGKGQVFFKKEVKSFNKFYKLRLWSTKNMLLQYWKSPKLAVMIPLLGLSFGVQKWGYLVQKIKGNDDRNENKGV